MEVVLNVFWLLLALVSFGLLRRWHFSARNHAPIRPARGIFALGCALALLFPIISVTDDLHGEQIALEDSNYCKRELKSSKGLHPAPSPGKFRPHPTEISCLPRCPVCSQVSGRVSLWDFAPASRQSAPPSEGRAPPSSLR